ncbi:MAG: spore germination protein [Clostridia bacterium]|nr:spore germination protein [Clostridia bacterium]
MEVIKIVTVTKRIKKGKSSNLVQELKKKFKECADLVVRPITDKKSENLDIYIFYFNNLVNIEIVDIDILRPICTNLKNLKNKKDLHDFIISGNVYHAEISSLSNINEICDKLYDGNFVIVCEDEAYIFDAKKYEKRSIGDASVEASVKGAKDSFIEIAATNLSLVRRRIRSNKFKSEQFEVGSEAKVKIYMVYMEGVVNDEVLSNVREKINIIQVNAITSPSAFEENICERNKSIFPQLEYTERPDKFCSCIIEGKVGIFVDGIPIGYIAPGLFNMLMQDPEEYSISPTMANIKRLLRYIALFISLLLAGFYVAITTFHPEMLPTKLVMSIVRSKQDVPFQTYTEVIIMLIAFEMILEAGARLPKNIGQTISIIGGLIIGDAAVVAKLVSPAVVVVVAAVGVSGFIIPNQDLTNAIRICRFGLVILASIAGFFGLSFGIAMVLLYLASYESFGHPYMKPFVAGNYNQMTKDTFIRGSLNNKKKIWW